MCIYNFENKNNKNEKKVNRDTFYCERELNVEECFFFGFLFFSHLSSSLPLPFSLPFFSRRDLHGLIYLGGRMSRERQGLKRGQ